MITLGPLGADDTHEPFDRFVERRVGEVVRPSVVVAIGHAGVVVAEQVHGRVPDRVRRVLQLLHPHREEVLAHFRRVDRGIQDVAGLATGAAHEHRPHTLVAIARHGTGALRGLVVGVCMHREQAQRRSGVVKGVSHDADDTDRIRGVGTVQRVPRGSRS
jgi:hypothetical protein